MLKKKMESFGEQVTAAVVASLDGNVSDMGKCETVVENLLSPDLSLREVAAICASVLGGKAMLWPGTVVADAKAEFEKQWSFYVGGEDAGG